MTIMNVIFNFGKRVRLSSAYNFSAEGPLQHFSNLPGGEQYGYAISDGRSSTMLCKILPGYFQSNFPRDYDKRRLSYIPPKGTSNAWKNSLTIADNVPGGHILVFLNPEDDITASIGNLRTYGIHVDRLFVFIDKNGKLMPVDIKTGLASDSITSAKFPENMRWLLQRIQRYEQTESFKQNINKFDTLVVGCADKRMNTMFEIVSPNSMGFEHLRFPGGFVRPKGISATMDRILEKYSKNNIIIFSHTGCVAVREVDKGVMHDPVISEACSQVRDSCIPGCSHEVEDITCRASIISRNNLISHGVDPGKISMLQYDVASGLLMQVCPQTGVPYKDISLSEGFGPEGFASKIQEYNRVVLNACE